MRASTLHSIRKSGRMAIGGQIGLLYLLSVAALLLAGCSLPTSPPAPGGEIEGFVQSEGVQIHWILDLPSGTGPHPAIVYGQGSGSITADFASTRAHARELNELGYAVIRYDKRGTGRSGGVLEGLNTANSEELIARLAADMEAVLVELLGRPEIDASRIGLFGISQATWFMPVVAKRQAAVDFVITLTGGVLPVGVQTRYEELFRIDGLTMKQAEDQLDDYSGPLGFDPVPPIEAVDIPRLYLLGDKDEFGPLRQNLAAIEDLQTAGNTIQMILYAGGRHGLDSTDFWPDVAAFLAGL